MIIKKRVMHTKMVAKMLVLLHKNSNVTKPKSTLIFIYCKQKHGNL